jgi:hypothetical protein
MCAKSMSTPDKKFWRAALVQWRRFNRNPNVRKGRDVFYFALVWMTVTIWLQIRANRVDKIYAGFWETALMDGILIVPGGLLALWLRRKYKQQDDAFSAASITSHTEPALDRDPRIRNYLVDRAAILAVLLARVGSEAYISEKELPEGTEVITRQSLLTFLRENGLWEKLEAPEVELLSAADGHWSRSQIQEGAVAYSEQLRLLRWTLQIDLFLPAISRSACPDYRQSKEFIERYSDVRNDTVFLSSWDLRLARDEAWQFVSSNLTKIETADASGLSNGTSSVADEGRVIISFDGARSYQRSEYAAYLTDLLIAGLPISFGEWRVSHSPLGSGK